MGVDERGRERTREDERGPERTREDQRARERTREHEREADGAPHTSAPHTRGPERSKTTVQHTLAAHPCSRPFQQTLSDTRLRNARVREHTKTHRE